MVCFYNLFGLTLLNVFGLISFVLTAIQFIVSY